MIPVIVARDRDGVIPAIVARVRDGVIPVIVLSVSGHNAMGFVMRATPLYSFMWNVICTLKHASVYRL